MYWILYFQGGLLDGAEEVASEDLVTAMKTASSKHPHLTAEVWRENKKVAVVRPVGIMDSNMKAPSKNRRDSVATATVNFRA